MKKFLYILFVFVLTTSVGFAREVLNVQGILDGDKIQFLDEKEHLVFPDEVGVYYEGIRIGGLSLGRNTRTTLEQVKHGLAGKKVVAEYSMSGSYIEGFIILQN